MTGFSPAKQKKYERARGGAIAIMLLMPLASWIRGGIVLVLGLIGAWDCYSVTAHRDSAARRSRRQMAWRDAWAMVGFLATVVRQAGLGAGVPRQPENRAWLFGTHVRF